MTRNQENQPVFEYHGNVVVMILPYQQTGPSLRVQSLTKTNMNSNVTIQRHVVNPAAANESVTQYKVPDLQPITIE